MSIIEKAVDKIESARASELEEVDASDSNGGFSRLGDDASSSLVQSSVEGRTASGAGDSSRLQEVITIPYARLKTLGILTPNSPRSRIAEEYRAIKRPLLMNIEGTGAAAVSHANLIMVSSALPGEGKTFTAINLAMSIAMEQDKTVLLVDADVSKASAGELLGVPQSRGLIDVLIGEVSLGDALLHTDVPNLRLLPAGEQHDRATELLASDGMRKLMLELSQRYSDRVVIFDSPPLLVTSEACVLAGLMGQIVLVVAAERTTEGEVNEAVARLDGDPIIGMVLNKSRRSGGKRGGYGYGYGSAYGYGYGRARNRATAED